MRVFWILFYTLFVIPNGRAQDAPIQQLHGIARHKDLKYPKDFPHLDYVNPNAPKGGTLRLGVIGTFDSTNPYITKGTAPVGLSRFSERFVFESLMMKAADEPFSLYGWIAESVAIAPDHSWIVFHLNPDAKWQDGKPITQDDVIFTHLTFKTKGPPNFRRVHGKVERIEKVGAHGVKITLKKQEDGTYNSELPYIMALSAVLPKHYFDGKDFEKTSIDLIPGSGPYKIVSVKPGHRIVYERRDDYWAKDLNVMKGMGNFDRITVDYYRDVNVARMAFLAGEFDHWVETKPNHQTILRKKAANPEVSFKRLEFSHQRSTPFSTLCMNTRKKLFADKRVRRALALAFDFHWINTNLFHGLKKRNRSFFENTDLSHQGPITEAEKKLLDPFRDELPTEVFTKPYYPPNYDNSPEGIRHNMRQATALLKEAGYIVENGQLKHQKTGQPFTFELMLYDKDFEKVALVFARSLKTLGIHMTIRTLDTAQYETRRLKFDFDMILQMWYAGHSPGNELIFYWGSNMADQEGSRNYPAVKSKAVDHLCHLIANTKNRHDLKTACHALDRVLMWGEYVIPLYYSNDIFVAYDRSLDHPLIDPKVPILLATWWKQEKK